MNKLKYGGLITAIGLLAGCSSVATMAGYDTAALNQTAAKQYRETIRIVDGRYRLDTESETARRIHAVFERMKPVAEQANQTGVPFDWQMAVIKSDEPNAWAMPGGKMAVNTGMVEQLQLSDDEIAAVIGHEMTHALREDGKKAAGGNVLKRWAGRTVGIAVQATTGISGGFAGLGADLIGHYGISQPYSRSQENRADEGGMQLMAKAGYHPQAAISVWQKMNAYRDNNNLKNSIASSHPTHNTRIENLRRYLPQVMPIYQQHAGNSLAEKSTPANGEWQALPPTP